MRGPTRSASVMAATTSGWLMVWPKAIGSAVLSQARSAKGPATKRSRSTAATAASTFSSAMPSCLSSAIRRCMAGTFIAPAPASHRLEMRLELAAHALVREIEVQGGHRDRAGAYGGDIAVIVEFMLARRVANPVVDAATRIDPLDDMAAEAAYTLARHLAALHRGCHDVGEIDVDQHVARPFDGQHAACHVGAVVGS